MPDGSQAANGEAANGESGNGEVELRDEGSMIVATVRLPGCSPERALSAFTDPALLASWWRGELTAELAPGGEYSVWFAAIPARLTGQVLSYRAGSSLAFCWAWEGDDAAATTVTVTAAPVAPGGAQLTIEHGPHSLDETDQKAHKEHWDGWAYFLPRLQTALS
jgi:uncharacterized protein YndB with AHSA1/START domain